MSTLNYSSFSRMINQKNWWFTPSECHGIISALTAFSKNSEYKEILAIKETENLDSLITQLCTHIENTLQNNELSYQLLLTDDENLLIDRAESFVMWCQGFTLATAFLREKAQLIINDEEIKEYLHDVEECSKLDINLTDNENNRQLLTHLEEHCRLGVLMIYADYHRKR